MGFRSLITTSTFSSLLFSLTLGLGACGSDGGGNGGNTSQYGDRNVKTLSAAELQTVCEESRPSLSDAEINKLAKVPCLALSIFTGECSEASVNECIAGFAADIKQDLASDDCSIDFVQAECDVTVDQLNACFEAQLEATLALADSLTCENILTTPEPTIAACDVVEQKCPSALEGTEE